MRIRHISTARPGWMMRTWWEKRGSERLSYTWDEIALWAIVEFEDESTRVVPMCGDYEGLDVRLNYTVDVFSPSEYAKLSEEEKEPRDE